MLIAKMNQGKDGDEVGSGESLEGEVTHWAAPHMSAPIYGRLQLPASKSLTGRELILSALADAPGTLHAPLHSRDSDLMVEAMRALGARIEEVPGTGAFGADLRITPTDELTGSTTIECGLAGTVMRFVPPLAALALGPVAFDGDPYARKRPMRPLLEALRALGADISDEGRGALPFTVHGTGTLAGGRVEVDASLSSQFVSALLLAAPRFTNGVHVVHTGEHLPSVPHIEMTLAALRARGVTASSPATGEWLVEPGPIAARNLRLEPDLSNAAPFLSAAVALGGSVTITDWPAETTQVGDQLRTILTAFGATAELSADGALTVSRTGDLTGADLHLPEAGELSPTVVGLAALAGQLGHTSRITGIGHTRHHETNRLEALVAEIRALGGDAHELEDGIEVRPATLHGGVWHSYADHRIATTGALIGLVVAGVEVEDIACTSKTLPQFPELWQALVDGPGAASGGSFSLGGMSAGTTSYLKGF
ncbi:3-phosphoshikimate 1-carboxyvinyltransferase [Leucobacter exalbidus]|uniref:3-phosphoshikimate 1-carboxyvinyltransferase n=1 Tax=Leucobacter exalbidus TaxID=662960 RepID=A0A940PKE7_9MICO|nr:3-phosphoshikimate 1-carboxyvinyltransferase [Leucobacter exalbidus]MBP1324775.1 3-phosphoshikimate 1-carboxyvinyltransferase [Leucobacter exalbidus]